MKRILTIASALTLATAAAAQDMLAVSWTGIVYSVDPATGVPTGLGWTGLETSNSMATAVGSAWVAAGPTLITLDPATGSSIAFTPIGISDVRSLAHDEASGLLYAIKHTIPGDVTSIDELWTIDPASGASLFIGATGLPGVQGLSFSFGELYGYVLGGGLARIDVNTGVATLLHATGGGFHGQFLASSSTGVLYTGQFDLYTIDPVTGAETYVGDFGGPDIRGLEFIEYESIGESDASCLQLPNSSLITATIDLRGTGVAGDVIRGTVAGGPPGQFGYFLSGPNPGAYTAPPGSGGILCIAAPRYRYNDVLEREVFRFDAAGVSQAVMDAGPSILSTNGTGGAGGVPAVAVGTSRAYQAWFRDGGGGFGDSNFSQSRIVLFN